MSIQREQIIQTAITILDRDGLDGVTLRRLAKELDIKAASIYWHIANKEELLDEMANVILKERFSSIDFDNDQREWSEWLNIMAHELRTAMLAHREGARVVAGAHPDIANYLIKLWDLTIRVLHRAGFSYGKAGIITLTITHFTFGSVIEEQASPPLSQPQPSRAQNWIIDDLTAMASAMVEWQKEDAETHFDTGVRILINGVRAEQDAPSNTSD